MNRILKTLLTISKRTAAVSAIPNRSICLSSQIAANKDATEAEASSGPRRRVSRKRIKTEREYRRKWDAEISWETSVRYMESDTYKRNYGQWKVWELFRRQARGSQERQPLNTRVYCIGEDGYIKYATPCAVCRDRFLVLHYNNVKLLNQFISPLTQEVIEARKTNLCQKRHEELLVAVYLAKHYGTISFHIPPIQYDYSLYYPEEDIKNLDLPAIEDEESIALQEEEDEVLRRIKSIEEYGYWHKHSIISHP